MRKYCFVPYPPDECQVDHYTRQSVVSVRKTLDHVSPAMCCIVFEGDKPECLDGYEERTEEEAEAILAGSDWAVPFP